MLVKFDDIKYKRPSFSYISKEVNSLLKELKNAKNSDDYISICKRIIDIQNEIEEFYDYADIRNMRNCEDLFFAKEIEYWNNYKNKYDLLFNKVHLIVLESGYRDKLDKVMPSNFFNTIESQKKISSRKIEDLIKKERNLINEYRSIVREKINYNGSLVNISFVSGFFSDKDRTKRKNAHDFVNSFFYDIQEKLDNLFYNLIIIRKEIANKLGFSDYSSYSLYKLRRFGYDYKDISKFRNYVIKYIVPLIHKLEKWKKEELGINKIRYYDTIFFKEMPNLKSYNHDLINDFGNILKELNNDTYNLYNLMVNNGYIDLENRNNKVNFSITNYLCNSKIPVITGNFKNSYYDLKIICHEFGHAYQKYNASIMDNNYIVSPVLKYPTFDIAEMFSQAMELIALKYIKDLFVEEIDYKKYCFMEIYNLICNMPYICLVDEFQEKLYKNDNLEKDSMRNLWLKLSRKYGLKNSNCGNDNLNSGGYFYRQTHIFTDPFYYIDYALSVFGAFTIYSKCENNLDLFNQLGSVASYYSLNELIREYSMPNPFDEDTFVEFVNTLESLIIKYRIVEEK